jgi:hypothetical protein
MGVAKTAEIKKKTHFGEGQGRILGRYQVCSERRKTDFIHVIRLPCP